MFHPLLTLLLSFLVSRSLAQVLISNSLPACGQQCPVLLQAQGGCVPPAAPVTNPNIYQSCFCQSAFLTPLFTGATSLCPACSPAEMGTIESWFQGLCAAPNQGPPEEKPAAPSTTSTSSKGTVPTRGANAAQGGATISDRPPPDNKGWISTHWKWVLMLIILFFGFSLIAWLGSYLHRRYHRRQDAEASSSQPDLGTWRPGQSVHDFGANYVTSNPIIAEKHQGAKGAQSSVQEQATETRKGSRRLTKSWLRRSGRDLP